MSSKIENELLAATGVKKEAVADATEYRVALMRAIAKLDDKGWDGLSPAAQDWYNDAATARKDKKDIPDFPDEVADAPTRTRKAAAAEPEAEAPARTRKASKPAEPEAVEVGELAEGEVINVHFANGDQVQGVFLEGDAKLLTIREGEDDNDYRMSKIEKITRPAGDTTEAATPSKAAAKTAYVWSVGDKVMAMVSGEQQQGIIVEFDDKNLVLDINGDEEVFRRSKVTTVDLLATRKELKEFAAQKADKAAAKPAAKAAPAADDENEAPARTRKAAAEPAADAARSRSPRLEGKPATAVIREVICGNVTADKETILKLVLKQVPKDSFKSNTFDLVFAETHKVLTTLKALGKLIED